jgi:iron complex outermembrane receptor protein
LGPVNYEWDNNSALQAGFVLTIEKIMTEEHGTLGEEGFKAVDKSFDSFNALGYKTNLADDLTLRLNLASDLEPQSS